MSLLHALLRTVRLRSPSRTVPLFESLEGKRLFATFSAFSDNGSGVTASPGTTGTWTNSGDSTDGGIATYSERNPTQFTRTLTLNLTLPTHTMVQLTGIEFEKYNTDPFETMPSTDADVLKITAGDHTETATWYGSGGGYPYEMSTNSGRWFAHSGNSLSIEFTMESAESGDYVGIGAVNVTVYNPTISASGGGEMTESGDSNGTGFGSGTAVFSVGRDMPANWQGPSGGDDPVPDTTVSVQRGGSATFGQDYTNAPGSDPLPATTLQLTGSASSKVYTIRPIDDAETDSPAPDTNTYDAYSSVVFAVNDNNNPSGSTSLLAKIFDDSKWAYYSPKIVQDDPKDLSDEYANTSNHRKVLSAYSTTTGSGVFQSTTYYTVYEEEVYNAWGPAFESNDYGEATSNHLVANFDDFNRIRYGPSSHQQTENLYKFLNNGQPLLGHHIDTTKSKPAAYGYRYKIEGFVRFKRIYEIAQSATSGPAVTELGSGFTEGFDSTGWRVTEYRREWLDEDTTPWPS